MLTSLTYDTEALEDALASASVAYLPIWHRLELRRLAMSLWYDAEMKKQSTSHQNHVEPLKAFTNFKANLQRRKKASDTMTSSRMMKIPEPARAILLSDIANTFQNEIDDYTQIDFSIEQIVKLFSDEDTQQEAVTIIRSLIDRIDITPGESRGKPKVELIGGLAAILQLTISGHKKTAIQEDSGICRVLMVAGAGFEPATFRL